MDSLAGYSPWGHKESDTTERCTLFCPFHIIVIADARHRGEFFFLQHLANLTGTQWAPSRCPPVNESKAIFLFVGCLHSSEIFLRFWALYSMGIIPLKPKFNVS